MISIICSLAFKYINSFIMGDHHFTVDPELIPGTFGATYIRTSFGMRKSHLGKLRLHYHPIYYLRFVFFGQWDETGGPWRNQCKPGEKIQNATQRVSLAQDQTGDHGAVSDPLRRQDAQFVLIQQSVNLCFKKPASTFIPHWCTGNRQHLPACWSIVQRPSLVHRESTFNITSYTSDVTFPLSKKPFQAFITTGYIGNTAVMLWLV